MTDATQATPGRYLTFHLGDARYAVPVQVVREVIRIRTITPVPLMPAHVRGVINLRGTVLAVIDLRAKFAMDAIDYGERACIVIFDLKAHGIPMIGALVDAVDDVVRLSSAELGPTPDFAGDVDASYLLGVATYERVVYALLDIPTILTAEGSLALPDVASNPPA